MVILTELAASYDVFLSFRGADTRLSFTNYLYQALVSANLATFLDDEEIPTGEFLKPELETAIKASRASVIVLSENYATSTWCLDELVLILEQKRISKQIVIPVFYHVEPTHVRKQQSSFGDAMEKHKLKIKEARNEEERRRLAEKMEKWKEALTEVSNLKGKDATGRMEKELIEDIVNDIYRRLDGPLGTSTLPQLIGMEDDIERITSWLKDGSQHTADILTIWGMGGIGKTSLANYVYELHRHEYTCCSFVGDISRRCAVNQGMLDVQKQLCGDICKRNFTRVHTVFGYTSMICKALAREKVLVVLDDIDNLDQLDELLGDKGFHPGSKIIITTRDASLTESCALFNPQVQPKHIKVFINGLSEFESLELLCVHAFRSQMPKEGYEEVSIKLVKYCEGHPLALKLLGGALRKCKDADEWEYYIEGLKKEPDSRITKALTMSFDSLPLKNDKELFKHIACFFVGVDKDLTETILNSCEINTRYGIRNLIDRCLLSIRWDKKLVMHQLVQEMGRDLVRRESPDKPWERSRLCCHEESFKVLEQEMGTENNFGIALDMRMLEKEKLHGSLQLKTEALNKMSNLRLLQLNYVTITGSYKNISKELRWLCMHGSRLTSIPSELPMENLVVLDMSHSNIKSFDMSYSKSYRLLNMLKGLTQSNSKDKPLLGSLKILDLSFCEQLCSLGGFYELPVLERLIISNCTNLIQVCESIKHCVELVFIDLSHCKKLKKLPRTIGMLRKVKTILSNGCDLSIFPTEMRDMDSLQTIEANNVGINSQTSSSMVVTVIPRDLTSFVSSLPTSLVCLSLINNNLSNKSFPMDFSSLSMLKELRLDSNPIVSMPSCVRTLHRLQRLDMCFCKRLKTVEHPPSSLINLNVYGCGGSLQELKFNQEMSLLDLNVERRLSSFVIEGLIKVQTLAYVEDEVLCSLGWANFELIKYRHLTFISGSNTQRLRIQMYYEYGIFSTFYEGTEIPNWIGCRIKGRSILFTIPSSPYKLRGLNFCYRLKKSNKLAIKLPFITIRNTKTKHVWTYNHHIRDSIKILTEKSLIFVSHWMFGKNEMEDGDRITIEVAYSRSEVGNGSVRECGVGLVYDDGRVNGDSLDYYKSWNHIIGGDLSYYPRFQFHTYLGTTYSKYEGRFRAFSSQKSDLTVHQRESRDGVLETEEFLTSTLKMIKIRRIFNNMWGILDWGKVLSSRVFVTPELPNDFESDLRLMFNYENYWTIESNEMEDDDPLAMESHPNQFRGVFQQNVAPILIKKSAKEEENSETPILATTATEAFD